MLIRGIPEGRAASFSSVGQRGSMAIPASQRIMRKAHASQLPGRGIYLGSAPGEAENMMDSLRLWGWEHPILTFASGVVVALLLVTLWFHQWRKKHRSNSKLFAMMLI